MKYDVILKELKWDRSTFSSVFLTILQIFSSLLVFFCQTASARKQQSDLFESSCTCYYQSNHQWRNWRGGREQMPPWQLRCGPLFRNEPP